MIYAKNARTTSQHTTDIHMIPKRRTLKSIEEKIGQKNLAKGLGVSTSTLRKWKKKNELPKEYHSKVLAYREYLKNTKKSKNPKLRNKRFDQLKGLESLRYYKYTETFNISETVFDFEDVPKAILSLHKKKIQGSSVDYFWITLNGKNGADDLVSVSTPAFYWDELLDIWQNEIDYLIAHNPSEDLVSIDSITISGKAFKK